MRERSCVIFYSLYFRVCGLLQWCHIANIFALILSLSPAIFTLKSKCKVDDEHREFLNSLLKIFFRLLHNKVLFSFFLFILFRSEKHETVNCWRFTEKIFFLELSLFFYFLYWGERDKEKEKLRKRRNFFFEDFSFEICDYLKWTKIGQWCLFERERERERELHQRFSSG